jgi:hypothetical protein
VLNKDSEFVIPFPQVSMTTMLVLLMTGNQKSHDDVGAFHGNLPHHPPPDQQTLYILYVLYSVYIYHIYIHGKCVKDTNVNVHTDKWLGCDLQRTDPASHQRGRPTETGQQIPDPNSWKRSNIWSNIHKVDLMPRHGDWLTISHKVTLTLVLGALLGLTQSKLTNLWRKVEQLKVVACMV